MQWNPTDDYAYVNGRKTNVKCGLNTIDLYNQGTFNAPYDNGIYRVNGVFTSYAPEAFVNTGAVLKTASDRYPNGKQTTLVFYDAIDLTNYRTLVVTTNQGTLEVDLTNVNQSAFIGITVYNSGGQRYFACSVATQKQDFVADAYSLAHEVKALTQTDTSTTFSISAITVR